MLAARVLLVFVCCSVVLSGCQTVKPWERGTLAKESMQGDPDSLKTALRQHSFFSKEASSGWASSGGGGCGCN